MNTDTPTETSTNHAFPCRKGCDRTFPSSPSRSMHEIRAHSDHKWSTTPRKRKTDSQKQETKRRYLAKLRARNIAHGLTSAGKPRKQPLRSSYLKKILPESPAPSSQQHKPSVKDISNLPHVLACPRCGLNIRNIAMAIAFGDK